MAADKVSSTSTPATPAATSPAATSTVAGAQTGTQAAPVQAGTRVTPKDIVPEVELASDIAAIVLQESHFGTVMAEVTFKAGKGAIGAGHPPLGVSVAWSASDVMPGPSVLSLSPIVAKRDGDHDTGGPGQYLCEIAIAQNAKLPSPLPANLTVTATVASGLKGQTATISKTSAAMSIVAGTLPQPQYVLKVNRQ